MDKISSPNVERSIFECRADRKSLARTDLVILNQLNRSYQSLAAQIAAIKVLPEAQITAENIDKEIEKEENRIQLLTGQLQVVRQIEVVRDRLSNTLSLVNYINEISTKHGDAIRRANEERTRTGQSPLLGRAHIPTVRTVEEMLEDLGNSLKADNPFLFHRLLYEIAQYNHKDGGGTLYDLLLQKLGGKALAEDLIRKFLLRQDANRDATKEQIINALQEIYSNYYSGN